MFCCHRKRGRPASQAGTIDSLKARILIRPHDALMKDDDVWGPILSLPPPLPLPRYAAPRRAAPIRSDARPGRTPLGGACVSQSGHAPTGGRRPIIVVHRGMGKRMVRGG